MRMTSVPVLALLALSALFCGCGKKTLPAPLPPPTAEAIAVFSEAAFNGDAQQVADALKAGMPVDQVETNGNSALMLASFNGHTNVLHLLLSAKADINLRDSKGRTALMFASSGPFPDAVKLLLEHGAEVNAIDTVDHFTALMFAAGEGISPVVDILLDHGADPKMKDKDSDTAAVFAKNRGFTDLAQKLQQMIDMP